MTTNEDVSDSGEDHFQGYWSYDLGLAFGADIVGMTAAASEFLVGASLGPMGAPLVVDGALGFVGSATNFAGHLLQDGDDIVDITGDAALFSTAGFASFAYTAFFTGDQQMATHVSVAVDTASSVHGLIELAGELANPARQVTHLVKASEDVYSGIDYSAQVLFEGMGYEYPISEREMIGVGSPFHADPSIFGVDVGPDDADYSVYGQTFPIYINELDVDANLEEDSFDEYPSEPDDLFYWDTA